VSVSGVQGEPWPRACDYCTGLWVCLCKLIVICGLLECLCNYILTFILLVLLSNFIEFDVYSGYKTSRVLLTHTHTHMHARTHTCTHSHAHTHMHTHKFCHEVAAYSRQSSLHCRQSLNSWSMQPCSPLLP